MSEDGERLQAHFAQWSTEELVAILRDRDEAERRPEAFEAIAAVLRTRGVSPEEVSALWPLPHPVLESNPTVTIGHFLSPVEAHAARMGLEESGIEAWVADEPLGTMYGIGVGCRLQVRSADEAAARAIIEAPPVSSEDLPPELAEPACPACKSRNVAPEAWVEEPEPGVATWRRSRRKWYYVCADCREAWPA